MAVGSSPINFNYQHFRLVLTSNRTVRYTSIRVLSILMQSTRAYVLTRAVTLDKRTRPGGESIIKIKTITYTLLSQMCFGRIIRVEMCATMLFYSTVDFVLYRSREKNKT